MEWFFATTLGVTLSTTLSREFTPPINESFNLFDAVLPMDKGIRLTLSTYEFVPIGLGLSYRCERGELATAFVWPTVLSLVFQLLSFIRTASSWIVTPSQRARCCRS